MTNPEAADVLREYIRTNKPCNGLEMALQKAITALQHQPEPQQPEVEIGDSWETYQRIKSTTQPNAQQCETCGLTFTTRRAICICGSSDLRPVYVSEIGRKA